MRSYTLQTKVLLYMLEQETKDGCLFFFFFLGLVKKLVFDSECTEQKWDFEQQANEQT